jgi:hypothetical protein
MTGTILHDLPSACVGYDTYFSACVCLFHHFSSLICSFVRSFVRYGECALGCLVGSEST